MSHTRAERLRIVHEAITDEGAANLVPQNEELYQYVQKMMIPHNRDFNRVIRVLTS